MDIQSLTEFIYEDLEARVTSVSAHDYDLNIRLECDDPKESRRRKFHITCTRIVEAQVTPASFEGLELKEQHVLLLDHIDDFGYLSFSSAPAVPEVAVSRLYEAHGISCDDWRPFSAYVNHLTKGGLVELLRGGMGMLAQGPFHILQDYENSLKGLLQMSLVRNQRAKRRNARLLLLDSDYVIAESFEAKEETV